MTYACISYSFQGTDFAKARYEVLEELSRYSSRQDRERGRFHPWVSLPRPTLRGSQKSLGTGEKSLGPPKNCWGPGKNHWGPPKNRSAPSKSRWGPPKNHSAPSKNRSAPSKNHWGPVKNRSAPSKNRWGPVESPLWRGTGCLSTLPGQFKPRPRHPVPAPRH
jgi:hypothetical protein